ncbi:unnamed protein product [Ectocarpus sp. CCAP 1310/34]|nr:unnamed protein product [Ectocarpus sp. CCAP 1310/34]
MTQMRIWISACPRDVNTIYSLLACHELIAAFFLPSPRHLDKDLRGAGDQALYGAAVVLTAAPNVSPWSALTVPSSKDSEALACGPTPNRERKEVDQGFVGGKELESDGIAVPEADLELDGTTNVPQRPDSGCHEIDQEECVEARPGQEDSPPSPLEEGGEGCNGIGRSSAGLVAGGLDPQLPNQQQSPTKNDEEPFAQQADDLERGGGGGEAGSVNQPHIQDARRHQDESAQEGSDPTDCLVNQHCGKGAAEDATDAAHQEVESVGKQTDTISSTSTIVHELDRRGSREEKGPRFAFKQDEGNVNRGDTRCSKTSALPPPTATPKLQRHPQAGKYVAPPTGSSPLFRDPATGLDRSQQDSKGGSTRNTARYATLTSTDRGVDRSRGCYGNYDGGHSGRINQRSCERTARTSKGFESGTKKKVAEARRGTKRRSTADVTLEQVIDHHMARRRLDGAANGPDGSRAGPHSSIGNASSHSTGAGADCLRGENLRSNGKRPSPCSVSDGANLVVAAWSSGCILPLTEAAAPHMRLVAPLLAGEPEGRRVVLRTAAAVATGAAKLALPHHRVEVTGVWQDGILLELCPAPLVEREEGEAPAPLSALAGRLQAAFNEIVAVDLEIDTVRLCHREALEKMDTGSSSEELLKWCNEGTTDLMRFAPMPFASHTVDQVPGSGGDSLDLVELRKALARPDGSPFIGIKHGQWTLLPRTGLLGCFSVSIHPVVLPLPRSTSGEGYAHQEPADYLALSFSDSAVFNTSGLPGVLRGDGYQSIGSSGGYTGTKSQGSARNAIGSDAAIADLPRHNGSARLECVSPTCTADISKWKDITGLRCVAAVNRLALGSPTDLERKLLLAEGLHTDQLGALAKTIILSNAQLVILAGRQGASADVVASRLCVELTIKGKSPAVVNTQNYRRQEAPEARAEAYMGQSQPHASSSASVSNQQLDLAALGRVVAALLGQDQDGGGFSSGNNSGGLAVSDGNAVAGARATSRGWHDIVVVHGCSALDADLLSMEDIDLRPAKAIKVFVDVVPQVCVDNVTPVNGADVRMLRALLAARGRLAKTAQAEVLAKASNGRSIVKRSNFVARFLEKWHVAEQREQGFWRTFQAAADVQINTALPYDLNALKPLVEPLLRSVPPPTEGSDGGDGCRSSAYALSRSVLHMLQLCEALHAQLPGTSVLRELIRPRPS